MENIDRSPTPLALMERTAERRGAWEDTDVLRGEENYTLLLVSVAQVDGMSRPQRPRKTSKTDRQPCVKEEQLWKW